jgi:metal-sulfur cluster biosynthetic enzyme
MSLNEEQVWLALQRIIDPELGVNIVDLGLVYEVRLSRNNVWVAMTLTSRDCPMGDILYAAVNLTLRELSGITRAEVTLVWDPPWSPALMTSSARTALAVPED